MITSLYKHNYYFKQGDIIYVDLGEGFDCEQGGDRPCIVLQNNIGNKYSPSLIIAPITTELKKKNLPTHYIIENYKEYGLKKPSMILFEQIRTISKKRIIDPSPKGYISLTKIRRYIEISFGLTSIYDN